MDLFYILLAFVAGACATTQAGINSQLRFWTNDPVFAAMISFAVGTAALLFYVLVLRIPWPAAKTIYYSPWWIWTGGLLGAFLVAVTVILVARAWSCHDDGYHDCRPDDSRCHVGSFRASGL